MNDASEVPTDLAGTVGVTAGASAPESLVQAVVDRLAPQFGVEAMPVTVEEEYFPPPPELRDLLKGLAATVSLLTGASSPGPEPILGQDRSTAAADVLAELAL